jgi:biotin operon repressor
VAPSRGAVQQAKDSAQRSKRRTSVTIELTRSQIRSVFVEGGVSESGDALAGRVGVDLATLRALIESSAGESSPKLSYSLLRGLYVLAALPGDGEPIRLIDLARQLGWSEATVHRYLQTLLLAGLTERDARTREYSLTSPAEITALTTNSK